MAAAAAKKRRSYLSTDFIHDRGDDILNLSYFDRKNKHDTFFLSFFLVEKKGKNNLKENVRSNLLLVSLT